MVIMLSLNIQTVYSANRGIPDSSLDEVHELFEYVIITDSNLEDIFSRLISYKSQFITSRLVNISSITSVPEFQGRDLQETIRNFIKYAHDEWSTKYVLLGGDDAIIPHRGLKGHMIYWNGLIKESEIPSDLYYAALDGTWDDDSDNIFGERKKDSIADEADYHADVYVGRAPVEDRFEASVFINKVISYETSDKPTTITLHQSGLNSEDNPNSVKIVNKLQRWIPANFTKDIKYAVLQNITIQDWIDCFKDGRLIVQHMGNGQESYYELDNIGDSVVWNINNISKLHNNFYPIHLSLACNIGNFVYDDCIAEEMILHPTGGVSSFICNSDYGATDADNIHLYSGEFLERQFYEIFENKTKNLGGVLQKSKEYFIKQAQSIDQYRWCFYTINLLGDPETPIFEKRSNKNEIIYSVDDDFTTDTPGFNQIKFSTIQQAIDQSNDNGLILVYNGEYHEHLLINKSVFLVGTNRDFENDYTYSGLSVINGNYQGNTVTITSDNVIMNGFTIINSGEKGTGILISNASNANLYRCNVVQNQGNGITFVNSTDCMVEKCIISFNENHGIALYNSSYNSIYCSLISYNINNAGILLFNASHNQISGKKDVQTDPFDYYISELYQKYQYNLSDFKEFLLFAKSFYEIVIGDFFDQLYYFPSSPPNQDVNIISTEYIYIVKNRIGILLEHSSENMIHHAWIQENEYGLAIKNTTNKANPISFNFISFNDIGVIWDNASLDRFELNNICYNKENGILYTHNENPSTYHPHQLLLSGNLMLNNDSFLPLFDYLSINGQQSGFTLFKKITSFVTYQTIVPMIAPTIFSQLANIMKNETRLYLRAQIFFSLVFLFFPVFLKIIKISNEPPLIRETFY